MTRLASLRSGGRDGSFVVVSRDGTRYRPGPVPTVQEAIERWDEIQQPLAEAAAAVERDGEPADAASLLAPLPRAYHYCEGSTYLVHMERNRAARGAPLPPGHGVDPAVLMGASDRFLAPTEPIQLTDPAWGLDLEATIAVIVGDVPMGVTAEQAGTYVRAIVLVNDLTLRNILPAEFAKGIGFYQAKPYRAVAPFAVTPDELGDVWDGHLLHATVRTWVNGEPLGTLSSGVDATFDFPEVIAHAARTRPLAAGTIVGTGTVSNRDLAAGFGCLAEKRSIELLEGRPTSRYLHAGDVVRIEAFTEDERSIFGAMEATVVNSNGGMNT